MRIGLGDTDEYETCQGTGELVGDRADATGERTDDIRVCPDCMADVGQHADADTDRETNEFPFVEHAFDFGGEAG